MNKLMAKHNNPNFDILADMIATAKEITTCEVADSAQAFKCQTEEQCDDCFMVDHLKECKGCEHYEHGENKVCNEK